MVVRNTNQRLSRFHAMALNTGINKINKLDLVMTFPSIPGSPLGPGLRLHCRRGLLWNSVRFAVNCAMNASTFFT